MFDNVEVSHQSGVSRLMNSMIAAICLAPLLLFISTLVVGCNEKRDACEGRAIKAGLEQSVKVGCNDELEGDGKLVLFTCDLQKTGLVASLTDHLATSDFSFDPNFVATGLKVKVEMMQCIQETKSTTVKDKGGGGGTTTYTEYTYKRDWRETHIDSSGWRSKHKLANNSGWDVYCGMENPAWPDALPKSSTKYASKAKVGSFTIKSDYIRSIPISTPVGTMVSAKPGTQYSNVGCTADFCTSKYRAQPGKEIGDVRVSFEMNDWSKPTFTVLGENTGGSIDRWLAPATWLCSPEQLPKGTPLYRGEKTKAEFFGALQAESTFTTWLLRLIGFGVAWFAFSLMAGPCAVAADCIPCIGPCLGDKIEAIACCISCLPGCACTTFVAGIVWVVMRPMIGIPCMLFSCAVFGGFAYYKHQKANSRPQALQGGMDSRQVQLVRA